MKKIYFTFLLMLPFIGFAQNYNVTLSVNAENITVGPNGVYAGGGFLGGSDAYPMDDSDSDDVWVVTLSLDPATANGGKFIFLNSPTGAADWGTKEVLAGLPCGDPANYDDRTMPTLTADTTLLFCFGACTTDGTCPVPPAPKDITLSVDMNCYTGTASVANGVYVNGTFNGWNGTSNPMDDSDNDGVYTVTLTLTVPSIEYKFTVDGWTDQELFDTTYLCTKTSGAFTNRLLEMSADTIVPAFGWNECGPCATNVGISEELTSFTVKPNPASDVLFIENTAGTSSNVSVYSITGALVMSERFENEVRLDVASLPRGMYIVRMENGQEEKVVRVALK